MSKENHEVPNTVYEFKLVIVGPEESGKTSIVNRSTKNSFSSDYQTTIGTDFVDKFLIEKQSKINIKLRIWDTAGNERFAHIISSYMNNTNAVGIVLTQENFQDAKKYYDNVKKHAPAEAPIYFIINKTDLAESTSQQGIISFIATTCSVDQDHILFCSALTGYNVENVFSKIGIEIYTQLSSPSTSPITLHDDEIDASSKKAVWSAFINNVKDFFSKHKIWMGGDIALIVGIVVTLVVLATLSIGSALVLGPLSALALAGIIGGATFLLWNAVWAINWWMGPSDDDEKPDHPEDPNTPSIWHNDPVTDIDPSYQPSPLNNKQTPTPATPSPDTTKNNRENKV